MYLEGIIAPKEKNIYPGLKNYIFDIYKMFSVDFNTLFQILW